MPDLVILGTLVLVIAPIVVALTAWQRTRRRRRHEWAVRRFHQAMAERMMQGARRRPKVDRRIQRKRTARSIDDA